MQYDLLKPELLFPSSAHLTLGDKVRQTFRSQRPVLEKLQVDDYSMARFDAGAFNLLSLLLDSGYDLTKANVLEIGCGAGMKSFPVAAHVDSYTGVDLDDGAIERAKYTASQLSLTNTDFLSANAAAVFKEPAKFGFNRKFDVVFLHAVMEHLTPDERAVIFPVIRECWEDGGLIIVGESPNRLLPFDYHSTELHFLQMLPDHIAIPYCKNSPREVARDVAAQRETSPYQGVEALYRLGRGLSYHDFELFFSPESVSPNVVWDSYHPALLNFQPISHAELQLAQYFRANSLPVHRLWSRANVDLHMWKGSRQRTRKGVEIADFQATGDFSVARAKEFWSLDTCIVRGSRSSIEIERGAHDGAISGSICFDMAMSKGGCVIESGNKTIQELDFNQLKASQPPRWHNHIYLPLSAEGPVTVRPADSMSSFAYKVFLADLD